MPINPVVFRLGAWDVHLFTAAIALAVFVDVGWLLWTAHRLNRPLLPWLDAAVGTVIGGLIGARALHILLESAYFGAHPDQVLDLAGGGFDWHGAVFGGLIGATAIGLVRRVWLLDFFDGLALAFPIGAIAVWSACGQSACAYGVEVPTLADYPAWLVIESPDVYGSVAPRLNLPQLGVWLGVVLFVLVALLSLFRWTRGLRAWIALAVFSLVMSFLDVFRGDYVPMWLGHRADQVLDLVTLLLATVLAAGMLIVRQRWNRELDRRFGTVVPQDRGRGRKFGKAPGAD